MSTLNNTQIRKVVPIHFTNKTWYIIAAIILWTLLTSAITYAVIYKNIVPMTCEPVELMKPVFNEDESQKRLITKVSHIFKITEDKAYKIVNLAQTHTTPNTFPSVNLLLSLMAIESSFKENAISSKGAKGLMQVMSYNSSGKDTVSNLYDAVRLLREYKEITGSVDGALHAYNVGIGNYKKKMRVPEYVNKVKEVHKQLLTYSDQSV